MIEDVLRGAEEKMKKAVEVLRQELLSVRTGRASPALVERLKVEYYGTPTPLNQLATIAIPESRTITIKPYDPSTLSEIEKTILKSDLGLTPANDGQIIRLNVPPLTQERRRELVKQVAHRVEEGRIAIRNVRRDALKDLQEMEKEKLISEDQHFRAKEELQKLTDRYIQRCDEVGKAKEAEILEV
ncbi:MAG: ribosome recycling factor [Chloroflexi bacterium]|nr:ribosome recycling factor [Chloroflexota bacterium]